MGHVFALNFGAPDDSRGTDAVPVPILSDDLIPSSFSYNSGPIPRQCGMCGSSVVSFLVIAVYSPSQRTRFLVANLVPFLGLVRLIGDH